MFNVPDLPTDSLYKFRAFIFFVFTIAAGTSAGILAVSNERPEEDEAFISVDATTGQVREIDRQIAEIDSLSLALIKARDTAASWASTFNGEQQKWYWNWKGDLQKQRLDLRMKYIRSDEVLVEYHKRHDFNRRFVWVLLVASVFFFVMTWWSFSQWKNQLQIYQDAVLMKEAGIPIEKVQARLEELRIKGENSNMIKVIRKRAFRFQPIAPGKDNL
jgi:hypothetical protein